MVDSCKIFSSSSAVLKACFILLGVVFIVHCVGMGTKYWVESDTLQFRYHSGLWSHCSCFKYSTYNSESDDTCFCVGFSSHTSGWMKGVQALVVIGLITLIIVGVLVFMQLFFTQSFTVKLWGILLTFCAGISILTGVILYGAMMVHNLHFSFGLCTVAGILCLFCALMLVQDRKISRRNQQSSSHQPYNIQYASQGHVIQPSQTQAVVSYTSQTQSPGYPPPYAQTQYGPPPSYPYVQQSF